MKLVFCVFNPILTLFDVSSFVNRAIVSEFLSELKYSKIPMQLIFMMNAFFYSQTKSVPCNCEYISLSMLDSHWLFTLFSTSNNRNFISFSVFLDVDSTCWRWLQILNINKCNWCNEVEIRRMFIDIIVYKWAKLASNWYRQSV